jgi:hypothetical protein
MWVQALGFLDKSVRQPLPETVHYPAGWTPVKSVYGHFLSAIPIVFQQFSVAGRSGHRIKKTLA